MDQLLPWLALIPAAAIGAIAAIVIHQRGSDWDWSAAVGALSLGGAYGLVLLIASVIYSRIVYR